MNNQMTNEEHNEAVETLEILHEISQTLNCGIDKETLSIIVTLIENGVDPLAVASIIKEVKNESISNA